MKPDPSEYLRMQYCPEPSRRNSRFLRLRFLSGCALLPA